MAAKATGSAARRRGRKPSAAKRRAILAAARELFVAGGYDAATMDDIADHAGVAKQTVYAHFDDKDGLFRSLIANDIANSDGSRHPLVDTMPETTDLEVDLTEFARAHLDDVMQPHLLRMRRMLIGEAERFPDLAEAWYEAGPMSSAATFARWFRRLDQRGLLDAPDPDLAAQHFNWLVLSIPLNRAMAARLDQPLYTSAELDRYATEAVRVFLAAYGVRSPTGDSRRDP